MKQGFDQWRDSYGDVVQQSVAFSGLRHDFFLQAKALLIAELLRERLGHVAAPSLLDVGCGVGLAHPYLRPMFATMTGTDPSAESIARATAENPGIDYRTGDGRTLPFESDSVDVATAICVMHHVPPPDWPAFVAEMRRVVRPGGMIAIIEHNPLNPLTRLAVARCDLDADAVLLPHWRTRTLLRDAGLADVEARHFLFLPSLAPLARRAEALLKRVPIGAQYAALATVPAN